MVESSYKLTFPATASSGGGLQLKLQKLFDDASYSGGSASEVPIIDVDYREFAVNTVLQRTFTYMFLPTGVQWIDEVMIKEGFRRAFKDNMRRMLDTGEYFSIIGVKNGSIFIDRLPREWVTQCSVYEKTGELLSLVFVEPVVLTERLTQISWRRITFTPTNIKVEISLDEDPQDDEAYYPLSITPNPYGFVPIIPFKLGTYPRGIPIWKPAESVIEVIKDVVNDIRLINAYHAAPLRYLQTESEIHSIGDTGFLQLGLDDKIGVLTYSAGESLYNEFEYIVAVLSDLLGIPIMSLLAIGRHASGAAIDARFDTLNRTAVSLREYVGEQMQLMFRMMCSLVSQGLVEVNLEDPGIMPFITSQVVMPDDSQEQAEIARTLYANHIGDQVDLSAFAVPNVQWVPLDKIDPQNLLQLQQALMALRDGGLISPEEARRLLELNLDHLVVANDLAYTDADESSASKLGNKLGIVGSVSGTT